MQPIKFTVSDLIGDLQQFDPDAEVRLATQPSWPFEWSLSPTNPAVEVELDGQPVVYLVEGQQLGYLPGVARGELAGNQRRSGIPQRLVICPVQIPPTARPSVGS